MGHANVLREDARRPCSGPRERVSFADLAAGLVLLLARPYAPGEQIRIYVPCLHDVVDAEVVRIGWATTSLATATGLVTVANTRMLRASPEGHDLAR